MHSLRNRTVIALSAAAVATAVLAGPAVAAPKPKLGNFFTGGSGTAGWSQDASFGSDSYSIRLDVPDTSSYAGVEVTHVSTDIPMTEPSFEFMQTGIASGGSPRLVIESADGCIATEYAPLDNGGTSYSSGWHTASMWDLMGTCAGYNVSYAGVTTVFEGRSVDSVYIVDDSFTGAHTTNVDDIQYDGVTFSSPTGKKSK